MSHISNICYSLYQGASNVIESAKPIFNKIIEVVKSIFSNLIISFGIGFFVGAAIPPIILSSSPTLYIDIIKSGYSIPQAFLIPSLICGTLFGITAIIVNFITPDLIKELKKKQKNEQNQYLSPFGGQPRINQYGNCQPQNKHYSNYGVGNDNFYNL